MLFGWPRGRNSVLESRVDVHVSSKRVVVRGIGESIHSWLTAYCLALFQRGVHGLVFAFAGSAHRPVVFLAAVAV